MSKGLIIGLAIAAVALVGGGGILSKYVGKHQTYVGYENAIDAQDKEMQNVDTEVTQSLQVQGLAANQYGDLVKDAIKAANSGRYGADGSKAMMQWIKEQNPTIDPSIFKKIMVAAEAGYAKFAAVQKTKIDLARAYKTEYDQTAQVPLWGSFVNGGFPRKPFSEFEKIVVSGETKRTFETGVREKLNPFAK